MINATDMIPNQPYQIESIQDSPFLVNFLEIGIFVGKRIKLLHKAPFSGPLAFEVEGNQVFMRKNEAKMIQVVPENEFLEVKL
ncbi:FeoA family protein [Shivajiella indica]|uniref:Ferrous iron transport protein A n=1 Tax=Shivajiella indica TaxID=872115 RepID=A0ABW5B8U9_9BACT